MYMISARIIPFRTSQCLRKLPEFNSQNVSNLVWAAATLGLGRSGGGGGAHLASDDVVLERLLRRCCEHAISTLRVG